MMDFLGSIANILGEYLNKLIDVIFKKKEGEKRSAPPKVFVIPDPNRKAPPWTRKKI